MQESDFALLLGVSVLLAGSIHLAFFMRKSPSFEDQMKIIQEEKKRNI